MGLGNLDKYNLPGSKWGSFGSERRLLGLSRAERTRLLRSAFIRTFHLILLTWLPHSVY